MKTVVVLLFIILCMPAIAEASFFDDGRWYMDSSLWETGDEGDPENRLNVSPCVVMLTCTFLVGIQ